MTERPRNIGFDLLRIVAAFAVVAIHAPCPSSSARHEVLAALPYANAIFAFLAGYFLFHPDRPLLPLGELLKKRVNRLLVPYVLWEALYTLLGIGFDCLGGQALAWPRASRVLEYVLIGAGSTHLWFVIGLFYAQFLLAGLATGLNRLCGRNRLQIVLPLVLLPLAGVLFAIRSDLEPVYARPIALLLSYGALGAAAAYLVQTTRTIGTWVGLVVAPVSLVAVVASYFRPLPEVVRVLSWVALFGGAAKVLGRLPQGMVGFIGRGASYAMGIYLVHALFDRALLLAMPRLTSFIPEPHAFLIAAASVAFLASALAVHCLRKVQAIRKFL